MSTLSVLYDDGCAFCRRCRAYLEQQQQLVPLLMVPMGSVAARELMGARVPGGGQELVVVADDGAYWVGPDAFLMCLWALEGQRALAVTLSHPWLRPLSAIFFDALSAGRPLLSTVLSGGERCEGGHCGVANPAGPYR